MLNKLDLKTGLDISECQEIINKLWEKDSSKCYLLDPYFMRVDDIDNNLLLVFNIAKGKLAKYSYLNNYPYDVYKGVKIGMKIEEISKAHELIYNDDENYFMIKGHKGIALSFENPYIENSSEKPDNRLEEVTFFDHSLLEYGK